MSEKTEKKTSLASSQVALPVIDCRVVALTWHTLCRAAYSQSVQLPAYIRLFVRLAGWVGSLAECVSLSRFAAPRWDLRAALRIIQGQAHLESLSWLHLPVSKLVLMKSRTLPTAHTAWLALVKPIICTSKRTSILSQSEHASRHVNLFSTSSIYKYIIIILQASFNTNRLWIKLFVVIMSRQQGKIYKRIICLD